MKIEIIRAKRKTMSLKVLNSEKAVLKAPITAKDKKISEFIDSKQRWLNKISSQMKEIESFARNFNFDKYIYLNGKPYISVADIELGFEHLSAKAKKHAIKNYYLSMFGNVVNVANRLSATTGLVFNEIKPYDSVRVWGSYNAKGLMKLNFKLLILPEELTEYVIYHELCHSIHLNHKPQFWKHLAMICPDYKKRKKELAKYSFVLKSNF